MNINGDGRRAGGLERPPNFSLQDQGEHTTHSHGPSTSFQKPAPNGRIDRKILDLKKRISPGRSRVYVDRDWSTRIRVTHQEDGSLSIALEDVPEFPGLTTDSTLDDWREQDIIIYGPHVSGDDARKWFEGRDSV